MKSTPEEIKAFEDEFNEFMKNRSTEKQKLYKGRIYWNHGSVGTDFLSVPTNLGFIEMLSKEEQEAYNEIYNRYFGSIY